MTLHANIFLVHIKIISCILHFNYLFPTFPWFNRRKPWSNLSQMEYFSERWWMILFWLSIGTTSLYKSVPPLTCSHTHYSPRAGPYCISSFTFGTAPFVKIPDNCNIHIPTFMWYFVLCCSLGCFCNKNQQLQIKILMMTDYILYGLYILWRA